MELQASDQIKILAETLTTKFGVKRIIIFGSHAYGKTNQESDIDVCVITDLMSERKIDVIREMRRELIDVISNPLDILVYSEAEFNERANLSNTLEFKILTDGTCVYG